MSISERQFVELLRRRARQHATRLEKTSPLRRGIGEDCAVIAASRQKDLLITTDLFLEGVHFRRQWQEPPSVGYKALARGLSDIAAMGGVPRYAFLSLGLPRRLPTDWMDGFWRGFFRLAAKEKVVLAGGDTGASASGVVADVMIVGETPPNRAILRSGARPGEEIWVTGRLGMAASGLRALQEGKKQQGKARTSHRADLDAFFFPQPRLRIGQHLREKKLASAMIDLSDGLSIDLARLCEESQVGARILEASIPRLSRTPMECALDGGEDLELLFTVPAQALSAASQEFRRRAAHPHRAYHRWPQTAAGPGRKGISSSGAGLSALLKATDDAGFGLGLKVAAHGVADSGIPLLQCSRLRVNGNSKSPGLLTPSLQR